MNKIWAMPPMDFLSKLSLEEKDALLSVTRVQAAKKGEFIFHAGSPGKNVYILTEGRVKIYEVSSTGREIILWFCFPGEMFGLAEITRGSIRSVYAQASSRSELLTIPMDDFQGFLRDHPPAAMQVIDLLSCRLRVLGDMLLNVSTDNVESRVVKLLTRLGSRHGKRVANDLSIDIHLTHQEMADMIGTSRQTVTSAISVLKKKGLIRIENQRIHLHNLDRLQELYDEEINEDREASNTLTDDGPDDLPITRH